MLQILPDDLSMEIHSNLNVFETVALCSTSNENLKNKSRFKNKIHNAKKKMEYIRMYFCPEIIVLMGGKKNMLLFPILKLKDRFIGSTDYIDNIHPKHLSSPIMIGKDRYHRPFISIRTIDHNKHRFVTTLFQRYTNDKKTWTHGSYRSSIITESGHFMTCGIVRHELLAINIYNLLNNRGYLMQYSYNDPYDIEKVEDYYLV